MTAELQRIQIIGLHGTSKCIDAQITDNTLILVGENGSGKTTFLRILFNILARRWQELSDFRFDSIVLTLNGEDINLPYSEIINYQKQEDEEMMLGHLPNNLKKKLLDIIYSGEANREPELLERYARHFRLPLKYLIGLCENVEDNKIKNDVLINLESAIKLLNAQILYLPTYRRIERELASVFYWMDSDDLRRKSRISRTDDEQVYTELVEFGMKDVKQSIEDESNNLQKFQRESLNILTLTHFGEIVSLAYQKEEVQRLASLSNDQIQAVLSRVDESIVDSEQRNSWFQAIQAARSQSASPSDRDQIICHYFLKILEFQNSLQEKEKKISTFCKICSEYIVDKEFVYDSTSFKFSVCPKSESYGDEDILLSHLSSGEKQIVSLFSHLYLSGQSRYFVLIDEPELSLSVPWQRRFLIDIKNGDFCSGLIAVTHSPFIYDNELRPYAHSLGEFTSL